MLIIDGNNYDDYIVENSYTVVESPEYGGTDYLDGWWKKHRTVVRTRVTGQITLAMLPSAYQDFLDNLEEYVGTEGDHEIRLYVNNKNMNKTITAYVAVDAKVAIATKEFNHSKVFFNVVLSIEER